jgi:hypothetical protein
MASTSRNFVAAELPLWDTRARGFFLPFLSPFKAVVWQLANVEKWKGWRGGPSFPVE